MGAMSPPSLSNAARRELLEETGWEASEVKLLLQGPTSAGMSTEMIAFCRDRIAHFKAPKTIFFGPLPKTATGKIQKFLLRETARALGTQS